MKSIKTPPPNKAKQSKNPTKTLVYRWLQKDIEQHVASLERGMDVGCHEMPLRRFFKTSTYMGVDINLDRLNIGKSKYPEAIINHCSMFELSDTADIVVCLQTININSDFANGRTQEAVEKLASSTRPGGTLIFNIGPDIESGNLNHVKNYLETQFSRVTEKKYGRLADQNMNKLLSKALAALMSRLPALRIPSRENQIYRYFCCYNRLSQNL